MPENKIRCINCGKIIGAYEELKDGKITIICPNSRCKTVNTLEVRPPERYRQNQPYQNRMTMAKK